MNGSGSFALPSGLKASFSTSSSLYSTPCQSPALGSSLDSTNISLQSKDSSLTTAPVDNRGLLTIQLNSSKCDITSDTRPNSCSSGSSFNSAGTLLPPSSAISSPSTWNRGPDPNRYSHDQRLMNNSNAATNQRSADIWQSLADLKHDLSKRLFSLKQQVQSVTYQLNELETVIDSSLRGISQKMDGVFAESKDSNGMTETNELISTQSVYAERKSVAINSIAIKPDDFKMKRLDELTNQQSIQKLSALVKGYMTRRLMRTSKVKDLIKTIKDTTILLDNYRSEEQVAKEEIDFHRRLMIQLEKSLAEFHDIFFTYSKSEQMKLISRSREIAIEKVFRLSSENRRIQEKMAKRIIHDKRKDSPLASSIEAKQRKPNHDVEMESIENVPKEIIEPKPKATAKSRKNAKNTRKVSKEVDPTSSTVTAKSTEEIANAPRRSKRAATGKRATRGSKKST